MRDLLPLGDYPPREFLTPRLRLKVLQEADSQLLFDLYASDPVASRYMSYRCTGRIEDTREFVEGVTAYSRGEPSLFNSYVWVIELRPDGTPIGSCGFGPKNRYTLEGGYILNKAFWGKGYAAEAWGCLLDWAKTQPGVFRIQATHDVENMSSGKVMVKCGMVFEGILRRYALSPNISEEPRDTAMYAWARV